MVSSKAATVEAYLAELPRERAELVAHVRNLVNGNIPAGYVERMAWGMIAWELPIERYPDTYNGQALTFAALAAQKNHTALYLNCVQASEGRTERLRLGWEAAGKKLDMGKSCIRFKRREDLAEDAIARAIREIPPEAFIADHERSRPR